MATVERKCQKCGKTFQAKAADVKRGWARCCSKACAAHMREKRLDRNDYRERFHRPGKIEPGFDQAHLFDNIEHDCNKPHD